MAKGKQQHGKLEPVIPYGRRKATARWQKSYGMYITGQSLLDEVTLVADRVEHKWGAGRLRTLVGADLRERFDRQRYLYNQAVWFGELEDVRTQSDRMIKAWKALDKAAEAQCCAQKVEDVWDVISPEGNPFAIARTQDAAKAYKSQNPNAIVYGLEEIVAILDAQMLVNQAKKHFQEAEVVDYERRSVGDPLDDIWSTEGQLDRELEDEMPF